MALYAVLSCQSQAILPPSCSDAEAVLSLLHDTCIFVQWEILLQLKMAISAACVPINNT